MEPNFAASAYLTSLRNEVAKEGRDEDFNHLGKLIIKQLRQHEGRINQIDGYTGLSETNGSFLRRTQHFAQAMLDYGLNVGDVILISGYPTLDIFVPYCAAFYIGVASLAVNRSLNLTELQNYLKLVEPKMIFCTNERVAIIKTALKNLNLDSIIITQDPSKECRSIQQLVEEQEKKNKEFSPLDFDGAETIGTFVTTGGTTGTPKAAALTHECLLNSGSPLWTSFEKVPNPIEVSLALAPLQWISTPVNLVNGILFNYTRLHTSIPELTREHCYDLINKYKPGWTLMSPSVAIMIGRNPDYLKCDFSCFKRIYLVGSVPPAVTMNLLKKLTGGDVLNTYGMTEIGGIIFACYNQQPPLSSGTESNHLEYKIVDTETGKEITEPNKTGELLIRGNWFKKCYCKHPDAIAAAFTSDGWFRTGDLFYRDADRNYYFTDRLKLLMKYKGYHISPTEHENLIRKIPGVLDVVLTSITDEECGDIPVACVSLHAGATVTEEQIKNVVKENLEDGKQLRGGVIFMDNLPLLPSTKVDRVAIKKYINQVLKNK